MDEPADFADCATLTGARVSNSTGPLLASGINAASWCVYERGDGHTIIAPSVHAAQTLPPPRHLGWEGAGPQRADGPSAGRPQGRAAIEKAFEAGLHRALRELAGLSVANAIAALHAQHRADGRPVPFLPEGQP